MKNCWNAHPGGLPVLKLFVNYRAIEANRKLCVVSLGRDETVKLWDGLLGVDWVGECTIPFLNSPAISDSSSQKMSWSKTKVHLALSKTSPLWSFRGTATQQDPTQ
jgi:hypothetical protein